MLISWQVQCAFRLRRPTQNKQRGLGLGPRPQHPPPPPSHHPQHHHSTPHQPQHHHHHHHHHPQYHHFPPPRLKTIILNIIIIIINLINIIIIIIILIPNLLNSILLYPPSLPTPIWVSCRDNGNCPTWPGVWLPYGIKSSWCLLDIFICVLISLISSITYSFMHAFINFQTVYLFIHYRVCSEDWINKHIYICFR